MAVATQQAKEIEKVKLASIVASSLERLLTRTNALLYLLLDNRDGDSLAVLNDSTAVEELNALRLAKLVSWYITSNHIQDKSACKLFSLFDAYHRESHNLSIEAVVYNFLCSNFLFCFVSA